MTTPPSQDQTFRFLPEYKILLCVPCGYAVQPQAITSHLHRKEHHGLSRKQRQAHRAHALTFDTVSPEHIQLPKPSAMPVPGLRLMNGFACGFCVHLTTSLDTLKEHGRRQHNKRKRDGAYWREVKLQTFFRGNQLRYFIVRNPDDVVLNNGPVLTEVPKSPVLEAGTGELGNEGDEGQPNGAVPTKTPEIPAAGAADGPMAVPGSSILEREGLETDLVKSLEIPSSHPSTCERDLQASVLTVQPSPDEFRDFPKFLTEAIAASRAGPGPHAGVCVVRVPQGGLDSPNSTGIDRSWSSRCLQYFEQTSEVVNSTDGGIFQINHVTKGPTTISQWQKQVGRVIKIHGDMVDDDGMIELLSQERLKAVYVSNTAAKSISKLFEIGPIGLSHLPGNQLHHLDIPGMSSDYIYLGAPGSIFTMHLEDYNVHSFNYLRSGLPKRWVVVNPESRAKFEEVVKATLPSNSAACSQFMRHRNLYLSPSFLQKHGIGFTQVTQTPGDMLVLYPFAYHQGYNMGENLALASNFALESDEPLYEKGYVPCGQECCPGLAPLVLEFPLKRVKEVEDIWIPGNKKVKICSGRDGKDGPAVLKRGRGRPRRVKV